MTFPRGAKVFAEYYDRREVWPKEAQERWHVLREKMKA
ncbi:hypothetical protein J2R89_005459 [Bradyrhizobium elkanii]|nr:hypothetical protein [Bradyrhizobium elkanii]